MKLFNYLKLAVIFSILIFAFSCSDNENLDEIIEPELELMSRENSFTTDGIIVKDDDKNDSNYNSVRYIQVCFKVLNLTETEKIEAIRCHFSNINPTAISLFNLLGKCKSKSNCEIWKYSLRRDPRDGDDKEDEIVIDLNRNKITKNICLDRNIESFQFIPNCNFVGIPDDNDNSENELL